MDVTRSNFGELFPSIKTAITDASFITIDGEFTGLNSGQDVNPFDTPAECYDKLRNGSKDFLLIQLGVCIFRYDKENDMYKHRCYNFYAFPKPFSTQASDIRFLCQSSSIDFLTTQDFDFNKLFREGIPYLTQNEELRLREQLEELHKKRENSIFGNDKSSEMQIPPAEQGFIDDILSKIDFFLKSDESELIIDRCNSFLRKLIHETVRSKYPDTIYLETRTLENKNVVIIAFKCASKEDMLLREKDLQNREIANLEAGVGLSRVMQYIADSGKLVIGHNMLLDVMHIIKQFFGPLPESYSDFKDLMKLWFPRILDTKSMSNMSPFKVKGNSNALGPLLATLSAHPFSIPKVELELEGHGYSKGTIREHEAGYDAYITGLCFLSMANNLKEKESREELNPDSSPLKTYMNRVFLMRVQDQPYIHLAGKDPPPSRDHVFHITFSKEFKTNDIHHFFKPYGGVTISWLNETSAFISLNHREHTSTIKNSKSLGILKQFTIIPFKKYKKQPKRQSTADNTPNRSFLDSDKKSPSSSDKRFSPDNAYRSVRKRRLDTNELANLYQRMKHKYNYDAKEDEVFAYSIVNYINLRSPSSSESRASSEIIEDVGISLSVSKSKKPLLAEVFDVDSNWD